MAVVARMEDFEGHACIRSYHIYKDIWETADGEELLCEREPHNDHDRYAVAVKKKGGIIGHLPRKIARVCSLLLRRGDTIRCTARGKRQYSRDLPQGGVEVPCSLHFQGTPRETHKLKFWKS